MKLHIIRFILFNGRKILQSGKLYINMQIMCLYCIHGKNSLIKFARAGEILVGFELRKGKQKEEAQPPCGRHNGYDHFFHGYVHVN